MSTDLKGSIVAIVTPMHGDGSMDLLAFDRLVDWHVDAGTSAIVVVGTTGESATLSMEEHCDLVAHCVEVANKRIPVIAGTGSNSTDEALYFTRSAAQHGADAALLVTPYYNKPSQEGLYQHFKAVAEAVDIPQILYNVPGRTACDMSVETVERLAGFENIVGIKDATGDIPRGHELVDRCGDRLAVYSGEDAITLALMKGGAVGTISVTANVAPSLMAEMCGKALAGDFAVAAAVDSKLAALHENLFLEANPIPVKWALAKMGLIEPGIRLPLVELDVKYHVQVSDALEQAGISFPEAA
ncbi:MAG: 4-hydroxy-tetrahydrodipicolinate synthase [Pseudomonadales bacterium]|nr:4-hydroxy-tetrahydrodipicolinate synthase [Pseudomonadales bacterium]